MSLATQTGLLPDDSFASETALSNDRIVQMSQPRVLFFAGDDITPGEKYTSPEWKGFGGIFLGHVRTLKQTVNKGMLYRCKFTQLTTKYIDEPRDMLAPGDRGNWVGEFTKTQFNPLTQQNESVTVKGFQQMQMTQESDRHARTLDRMITATHTVYKQRYPDEDVREALKVNPPNGTRGVVEITALRNASLQEVMDAQLFFFPKWKEIQKGDERLPETIRELENHINRRVEAISSEITDPTLRSTYRMIGVDMLKSCTEFRVGGMDYLKNLEDAANEAKFSGRPYSYPVKGTLFGEMLEIKRKDDLVSGDSSAVDRLARTMEANTGNDRELRLREIELKERELALRERELGMTPKVEPFVPTGEYTTPTPETVSFVQPPIVSTTVAEPVEMTRYPDGDEVEVPVATSGYAQTGNIPEITATLTTTEGVSQTFTIPASPMEAPTTYRCGRTKKDGEICNTFVASEGEPCRHHAN